VNISQLKQRSEKFDDVDDDDDDMMMMIQNSTCTLQLWHMKTIKPTKDRA